MDKNLYNTLDKQQLVKRLSNEQFDRVTCSFYNYIKIKDPNKNRDNLYEQLNKMQVLGRIYIAKEGINAQISVPVQHWQTFNKIFTENKMLQGAYINKAIEDGISFFKLAIKVKKEIVVFGITGNEYDIDIKGMHLEPEEFNVELQKSDTIIVDMRNKYESEVGKFENAIIPDVSNSRELLSTVKNLLKGRTHETILLYCTGGIRCEKASAYLIQNGFSDVKQLKGGVVNYANQVKEKNIDSKFIGKNFVFDARLGERVTDDILGQCLICHKPADTHTDCRNQICHQLFIHCEECRINYEGCCSQKCQNIASLPIAEQRILRKKKLRK